MPIVNFNVHGQPVSFGWIIALLVLIACFVLWLVGGVTAPMMLGLIAALALAYLLG
jgi:uncharacterized membrane protein (DUF485 family)